MEAGDLAWGWAGEAGSEGPALRFSRARERRPDSFAGMRHCRLRCHAGPGLGTQEEAEGQHLLVKQGPDANSQGW